MFIDETTSREDLLNVIYGTTDLFSQFLDADKDPEFLSTEELRETIVAWIAAGDECAEAA